MTLSGSAQPLPRTVAGGQIQILDPSHAKFGEIDVFLTPNGSAVMLDNQSKERLIPQDAWAGLIDFLAAASNQAGRNFGVVSVGLDVLAHLYAQRVLRQVDLVDRNLDVIVHCVHELHLTPRTGYEDMLSIRFGPRWTTTHAGRRDPSETDPTD